MRIATILTATLVGGSAAWAWSAMSANPGTSVTAANLAAPADLSAAKSPAVGSACTSVRLSWSAVVGADRYRVERTTAKAAAWTTLAAGHQSSTYVDATRHANTTVSWRITPVVSDSSWVGPSTTVTVTCGDRRGRGA